MRLKILAFALVLAAAAAVVLGLRRPGTEPGIVESPRPAASRAEPPTADRPAADPYRGLRLLAPGEAGAGTKPAKPHPWVDYVRKRNAVRLAWRTTKLDVSYFKTQISDLPGFFSGAGLTLRVDPEVAALQTSYMFGFRDQTAEEILRMTLSCDPVRTAVGVDGVLWLVPMEGRAACEPEFSVELRRWESAARRILFPSAPPATTQAQEAFRAALAVRRRVEIVRQPLRVALRDLQESFGVRIVHEDRRTAGFDSEEEAPPPERLPVTAMLEEATLEEALKQLLEAQDLVAVPRDAFVEILETEKRARELADASSREAAAADEARETKILRGRSVRIEGTQLSAADLATAAAAHLGLHTKLDPLLEESDARWEAVDAELKLGEVLDAIEKGAKCRCELHPDGWPGREDRSAGWTLWVVTENAVAKQWR